jgi:serine/threonine protein kinase
MVRSHRRRRYCHTATPAVRHGVDGWDGWDQRATDTGGDSSNSAIRGRFQHLNEIGAGGFGVVYRARDRRTGEIVAVKCLHTNKYAHEDSGDRYLSAFAGEVTALEKCSGHPVAELAFDNKVGRLKKKIYNKYDM